MKKLNTFLENEFKNNSGSVLGIGIENNKLIDIIDNNNKITFCDLLNSGNNKEKGKRKWFTKKVSPKSLRKNYKKKKINYIICNYQLIKPYIKYFIKDSTYITKDKIYLFSNKKNIDVDLIKKRYNRYTNNIEIIQYKEDTLIIINTNQVKNNYFKDKIYFIGDSFYNLIENLTNFLIN